MAKAKRPKPSPALPRPSVAERRARQAAEKPVDPRHAMLAQVVNLHIAGFSLEKIGEAIGSSPEDVDRLLQSDAARYVRSQPALRVYVRNWVSDRYTQLLDAVWEEATDRSSPVKLENQDRALRILDSMRKLHGADAPVQAEVVVDTAPAAVEKLVNTIAASQGLGYDVDIFDGQVIESEVVHDAVAQAHEALEKSSQAVDDVVDDGRDSGGVDVVLDAAVDS